MKLLVSMREADGGSKGEVGGFVMRCEVLQQSTAGNEICTDTKRRKESDGKGECKQDHLCKIKMKEECVGSVEND